MQPELAGIVYGTHNNAISIAERCYREAANREVPRRMIAGYRRQGPDRTRSPGVVARHSAGYCWLGVFQSRLTGVPSRRAHWSFVATPAAFHGDNLQHGTRADTHYTGFPCSCLVISTLRDADSAPMLFGFLLRSIRGRPDDWQWCFTTAK